MADFTIRRIASTDEPALVALAARVVDGGQVAYTTRHRTPIVDAAGPGSVGFLAESATGEVVGAGWLRFGQCRLFGNDTPYGLLHSLSVHPDFRRRGVARALTESRLALLDNDVAAFATIQAGNAASLGNARRWAGQIAGTLRVTPVPARRREPRTRPDWQVRTVTPDDLPAVEALLAERDGDLTPSPASVAPWLAREIHGQTANHCYVLLDRHGDLQAVLGVRDDSVTSEMVVVRMPRPIALANHLVRVVAPDGTMRTAQVTFVAYRTAEAGRYLWQHVRWAWRDRVTSVVTTVDTTDPARRVLAAPRWLPATTITVAMRLPDERPLTGPIQLPL